MLAGGGEHTPWPRPGVSRMVVIVVQVRLLRSEAKWMTGSEFRNHLSPAQVGGKELCISRAHLAR